VEGFKRYDMPKLEIYRAANGKPLLHPEDPHIVAIATDAALDTRLPQLDLNDPDAIAGFVLQFHGFR
jgi:molybdopterin-guanine dinucleotide biosynthesis protein B